MGAPTERRQARTRAEHEGDDGEPEALDFTTDGNDLDEVDSVGDAVATGAQPRAGMPVALDWSEVG